VREIPVETIWIDAADPDGGVLLRCTPDGEMHLDLFPVTDEGAVEAAVQNLLSMAYSYYGAATNKWYAKLVRVKGTMLIGAGVTEVEKFERVNK
jgi:hypothetical protein